MVGGGGGGGGATVVGGGGGGGEAVGVDALAGWGLLAGDGDRGSAAGGATFPVSALTVTVLTIVSGGGAGTGE